MGVTQDRGRRGEDLAENFLRTKGYAVLARNVRTPHGEIDLVCRHNETLVVVEVKYRTTTTFGYPEDAIPGNKLKRLEASVEWYVEHENVAGDYQLDVMSIEGDPPQFRHLQNVGAS